MPGLLGGLDCLQRVSTQSDEALAASLNAAILHAAMAEELEQKRPANHELVDYFQSLLKESTSLLRRLGLPEELDVLPPTPDRQSDWFIHLRRGLNRMPALPWWLASENVLGLHIPGAIKRGQTNARLQQAHSGGLAPTADTELEAIRFESAQQLILAAPIILRLISAATQAMLRAYEDKAKKRGSRPDKFRHVLFADLVKFHVDVFGIEPIVLDDLNDRAGPSVDWAVKVLQVAADQAETTNFLGCAGMRALAQQSR